MDENKIANSYHTFIYPFIIEKNKEDEKNKDLPYESLIDHIKSFGLWQEDNWDKRKCFLGDNISYKVYNYFYPSARKSVLGINDSSGNEVVSTYRIKVHNNSKYKIYTNNTVYDLDVNDIRLKIFKSNVGALIIDAKYSAQSECKDFTNIIQDIKEINDKGRRLFLPYIQDDGGIPNECASCIELILNSDNCKSIKTTFSDIGNTTDNPAKAPQLIRDILRIGNKGEGYGFKISSISDDRMFVCCCITEGKYSERFKNVVNDLNQKSRRTVDLVKDLYEIINIDQEGSCSCQNEKMRQSLLEEQLYLRWSDYGTIDGITDYSMISLTGKISHLIETFRYEYVEIAILALMQRAALVYFDGVITESAAVASGPGEKIHGKNLEELMNIAEEFAIFQGQLLIPEVTPQIQGIEIYHKLQKALDIERIETNIQRQLDNLFRIAESNASQEEEKKQSKMNIALALVSFLAIASFMIDGYQFIYLWTSVEEPVNIRLWEGFMIFGVLAFILAVVIIIPWKKIFVCLEKFFKK